MICPKCKSENDNNALICSQCGFKLKLKCPHCGTFNPIGVKKCQSCEELLLKACPACKAVNFAQAKTCRKCGVVFSQGNNVDKAPVVSSEKCATVAIELINISSIKNNIKSDEMAKKVVSKFYQLFAKNAKDFKVKPLKINESVLVVEISNAPSFIESINYAVEFVEKLDAQLDEVSSLLENKLKVSYKVRYFIGLYKPTQREEIISSISLGVVDDIIFAEEIHSFLKEKMLFKEITNAAGLKFYKFLDQENPETIVAELPKEATAKTRMELISELINKVQLAQEGFVACVNAPTGVGKSNIFNILRMTYAEDNSNIWISGQCSMQSKNNTLFFFKDLLQNLFDIPAFNIDIENTKHRVYSFLVEKLEINDEKLIQDIFAILFYDESRIQNAIYVNKQNTYQAIAAIFRVLLSKGAVVLQIEDIENIDDFSLEILRSLFEEGILKCNIKIFVSSNMDIDIVQFFASPHLNRDNSYSMNYPVLTKEEIDDFVVKAIGVREDLGYTILNHLYEYSKGLPIFVEEFLYSLLQLGLVKFTNNPSAPVVVSEEIGKFSFPTTVQEIIQLRLTNMSNLKPEAFKALYYSSILGFKFLPAVVKNIIHVSDTEFEEIIKYLSMNNFIMAYDSYNYVFKSRVIWETVRNLNISDENKILGVNSTMEALVQLTMPDSSTVVENYLSVNTPKYEILQYIEQATKDAYTIGDDYSYVYHKTMLLDGVELSTLENKNEIMFAIKEELLNMTYLTFPETAIKFADDLIVYYEPLDTAKTIDILGLMSVSFEATGNYLAAIECVDKALEKIDAKSNLLAGMMLYYSKLNSLLQLGRYEEVANIAQTTILPVVTQYQNNKVDEYTSLYPEDIKAIEMETKYLCAVAFALQGSPKALDVIQHLYNLANEVADNEYMVKAQLCGAILKVLQGESDEVENILTATQEVIPTTKNVTENTMIWLTLKNVCRYFKGEFAEIANELMMLANFCINIKKFALEPVVKGLMVKSALSEGDLEFAQNLAYEMFYKCSNNQWALGALVNWYMYCEISLYKENYDEALKVAQNALDVSEKANINNLFFCALFKLKIAQIYALRNDCDMAKINAAEAQQLAEINGYTYITALLGNVNYDILLKQITQNPALKNENIKLIYKYITVGHEAAEKLKNQELILQLNQKIENIEKFAQENGIEIAL